MDRLTIYNNRSIQILDGALYNHIIDTAEVTMPRGDNGLVVAFFSVADDVPVIEARVPSYVDPELRDYVWHRACKHLGRSLREIKEGDVA